MPTANTTSNESTTATDEQSPREPSTGPTPARGPRAHGFFWSVLIVAAAVSITGNALHALLHATALPVLAAAVAVIPPLALLAAVHGVALLLRAHARARGTHFVATAMTALIAAGAFWLSFTALRALAVTAGIPAGEAWLWPLIIEGSMAQATVALLALAHSSARTTTAPKPHDPSTPQENTNSPTAEPARRAHAPVAAHVRTAARTPRAGRPGRTPGRALDRGEVTAIAQELCARDPSGRRDPALVAKALQHHHLDGWNPTRIAAELNKSRSTISRILRDADTIPTPAPEFSNPPISQIGATESPGTTGSDADLSRAL
ncbi:DUF2637 domain-containing protein [Nocardia carnea]|uniref:DUF2637 domain-containing protein n=1 Tax=Nocardia carnea TaxID=37328 RepID=UPI0024581114|nr:DUF2637 domain-containing protein [Nocardia carnea]